MKKLTCKQIGGACDLEIRGETSGEIAKAASVHIAEAAKSDPAHARAFKEMSDIYNDKKQHATWQTDFKKMWDDAPEIA